MEKTEFNQEADLQNLRAELADKLSRGRRRATGGEKVINQQHLARPAGGVLRVLEIISATVSRRAH